MSNEAMEDDAVDVDSPNDFVLEPKLAIRDAHKIADQLSTVIDNGVGITIDASQVTSIDTSVMQVLIGFVNAADARGIAVTWQKECAGLKTIAQFCGLEDALGLDNVAGPTEEVDDGLIPVF